MELTNKCFAAFVESLFRTAHIFPSGIVFGHFTLVRRCHFSQECLELLLERIKSEFIQHLVWWETAVHVRAWTALPASYLQPADLSGANLLFEFNNLIITHFKGALTFSFYWEAYEAHAFSTFMASGRTSKPLSLVTVISLHKRMATTSLAATKPTAEK